MDQTGEQIAGPRENIRATQVLCAALMAGIVFFASIISFICLTSGPALTGKEQRYKDMFFYAAAGLALVCFLWARSAYQKKLSVVINTYNTLPDKLNLHRAALIAYMAPCEGAALFSIVVLFLTGNFLLLIITAFMLLAMFSKFPFLKKTISELNLDWKEQSEITGSSI
jgi:hypothetical protein